MAAEPHMRKVHVHKCVYGLCSKVDRVPHKKPTTFLTNLGSMTHLFAQGFSKGGHPHRPSEGSEGGQSRAAHAQIYPPGLCNALADACEQYLRN